MAATTTCLSSERRNASWRSISPASGTPFPYPWAPDGTGVSVPGGQVLQDIPMELHLLPGVGGSRGVSPGLPGRGSGQRAEPAPHPHPLPPGDRVQRYPGRVLRRGRAQAVPSAAGRGFRAGTQASKAKTEKGGGRPLIQPSHQVLWAVTEARRFHIHVPRPDRSPDGGVFCGKAVEKESFLH